LSISFNQLHRPPDARFGKEPPRPFQSLDEITGGAPYGATTIAGGGGSRLPTANELQGARYRGRQMAETANKLRG
jgi:multimeric flavodoxin WrbA